MAQRTPQIPIAKRRAAWLVGLWFAIGLQPCAVAALSALECPHCPSQAHEGGDTAHSHHGTGHDAHGEHGAATHGEPDCQADASDCCELDDAAFDGRSAASLAKDLGDTGDMPAVAVTPYLTYAPGDEARPDPPGPRYTPHRGVRLHAINCVYLD